MADSADTILDVSKSVVRNLVSDNPPNASDSNGLVVLNGAQGTFRNSRIENVIGSGAWIGHSMTDAPAATAEIDDSIVTNITPEYTEGSRVGFAWGVAVGPAATVAVNRSVIQQISPVGASCYDGSSLVVRDSTLRGITSRGDGNAAVALEAFLGGIIDAQRVLIDQCDDSGMMAEAMGRISLSDSILERISPSPYGYGQALAALGSGTIAVSRVAAVETGGAAIMATPGGDLESGSGTGSAVSGHDIYVADVRSSSIRVAIGDDGTPRADGPAVSYALHAGAGSNVRIDHGVLVRAGFGFYDASGTMTLSSSVISEMLDSAGASSGPSPTLTDMSIFGNADNGIAIRGDLPSAAILPPPTPACTNPNCL
jgi:hypothetical protein